MTIGLEDAQASMFEFELDNGLLGSLQELPIKRRSQLQWLRGVKLAQVQVMIVFVMFDDVTAAGNHHWTEKSKVNQLVCNRSEASRKCVLKLTPNLNQVG